MISIPYQPRRSVPWRGFDVLLLALVYLLTPALLVSMSQAIFHVQLIGPAPAAQKHAVANAKEVQPVETEHPLAHVLMKDRNGGAVVLCVLLAVVLVPITEEMLFRLLLQGWLESTERQVRRRDRLRLGAFVGVVPVVVSSTAFAAVHFRIAAEPVEISRLVAMFGLQAVAGLLTIAAIIVWLRFAVGATLADFGFVPSKLIGDIRVGLVACAVLVIPILALMFMAQLLVPKTIAPDPIPLFFLALALGALYYRTHRLVPCIVLHSAFNAVGVFLALAAG